MPIINLSITSIIMLDVFLWFILHMGISMALLKIPLATFEKENKWFRVYAWEKEGQFWQKNFNVRFWKDKLPDGATLFKMGFKKKHLRNRNKSYFNEYIAESRRAELNHWLLILPAPLFFLWNPPWASIVIICYALLANIPFIIIQRYNRPRFEQIQLKRKKR